MKYRKKLITAKFLKRENRFLAQVIINGKIFSAHIPNSGRLNELLTPNREIFLLPADGTAATRKTGYTLVLSRYGAGLVSLEAAKANDLFEEALKSGIISEFSSAKILAREKRIGLSRIDFFLEDSKGSPVYLEVKSVSLVIDDTSLFPDAPTKRGVKHLRELIELSKSGEQCCVAFIVQRSDALRFSPNGEEDPEFAETLREAFDAGVRIIAYRCFTGMEEIYITDPVPVIL